MKDAAAEFWRGRAVREALRFNLGWWAQGFLRGVVFYGAFCAIVVLAVRTLRWEFPAGVLFGLGGLLILALIAFAKARSHFLSRSEALTRLDADLNLHSRLSSAAEGVGVWPPPHREAAFALRVKWWSVLWPPLGVTALLLLAGFIPIPESSSAGEVPRSEPGAWSAVQERIDDLKEAEILKQENIQEIQTALDTLRQQPPSEWYRHESLEAGDHLLAEVSQSAMELQRNLEATLGAAEAARRMESAQAAALDPQLNKMLAEGLKGLEQGGFPLDEKMLSQLKDLNASDLRQLSQEEWEALQQKMKDGIATASEGKESGEKAGEAALLALMGQGGEGDISRGPGAAPLALKDQGADLGSTRTEGVSSEDFSRATMGSVVGLGAREHEVDAASEAGAVAGGSMATGSGGQTAIEQTATPAEQEALRRFFR